MRSNRGRSVMLRSICPDLLYFIDHRCFFVHLRRLSFFHWKFINSWNSETKNELSYWMWEGRFAYSLQLAFALARLSFRSLPLFSSILLSFASLEKRRERGGSVGRGKVQRMCSIYLLPFRNNWYAFARMRSSCTLQLFWLNENTALVFQKSNEQFRLNEE